LSKTTTISGTTFPRKGLPYNLGDRKLGFGTELYRYVFFVSLSVSRSLSISIEHFEMIRTLTSVCFLSVCFANF
jgi:hypothetical protein